MAMRDRFPDTSWTLLERARDQFEEGFRAREDFAHRYYRPIIEFLLAIVRNSETAEELAQEFFARLCGQGGIFEHAQREHGVFRNYLMSALRNLAIDYYRRAGRVENGQIHPDQWSGGGWDALNLPAFHSADAAFHNAWIRGTLEEALGQVRAICRKRGQKMHLDLFEARYLAQSADVPGWEELGARYGLDQKTARTRSDTVARHFRLVLRRMLRQEVTVPGSGAAGSVRDTEAAIDREIEALLRPLED